MKKNPKKIALFHPWIKSKGGAERMVLEFLKKSKHKIDVYTWFYNKEKTFEEFSEFKINIIAPKIFKKLSGFPLLRGSLFLLGILKKIPLENYDLFLISTSGVSEFITFRNHIKGKTIAYVHTPLREANKKIIKWNLENKYKNKWFKKNFYILATQIYKILEKRAWKKLDIIIFNSELSKQRAEEHNLIEGKKTEIIYPPINLLKLNKKKVRNYLVYFSRLNLPKRQDLLIKAWINFVHKYPKLKLIIIGNPENRNYFKKLKKLSAETKNIQIKTKVEDKELRKLISECLAGIFLGYSEDFGMVPIEILSAGKPLIAVDEGGYVKIIENNPKFYKIKERHSSEEMIKEIEKGLEYFMKNRKKNKKGKKEIKVGNFIEEIDSFLEEID